jgi:hypothetical protein
MIPNRCHLLFLLLSILLLGSQEVCCQSFDAAMNVKWILQSFDNDDGARYIIPDRNPSILFTDEPGMFGLKPPWRSCYGMTPCNQWDGEYRLREGDSIDMAPFAGTLLYCGKQGDSIERQYLDCMAYATRYEVNGNALRIHYRLLGTHHRLNLTTDGSMSFIRVRPRVRLVNLIQEIPSVDLYVDRDAIPLKRTIHYGSASANIPISFGPHALRTLYTAGGNHLSLSENIFFGDPDSIYTCIATGPTIASVDAILVTEPPRRYVPADSIDVRLLIASRKLNITGIEFDNIQDSLITRLPVPPYMSPTEHQMISAHPFRLKISRQGVGSPLSFSGEFLGTRGMTLIIQGSGDTVNVFVLQERDDSAQSPLQMLHRTGEGTGSCRVVDLVAQAPRMEWRLNGWPYGDYRDRADSLELGEATQLFTDLVGTTYVSGVLHDIGYISGIGVPIAPDSASTFFMIAMGDDMSKQTVVLRTPLAGTVSPGRTRLRYLHGAPASTDPDHQQDIDIAITCADGSRERITGLKLAESTAYNDVTAGPVTMTLYRSGDSVPLLRARGILPEGYVTAIPCGNLGDSTLSISLLLDRDSARQAPMMRLQPLPPDTTKGWFRGVNLMPGGAELCTHYPEHDSACLQYRMASESYEGYAGSPSGPLERNWETVTPLDPVSISPDTLKTLFTLGPSSDSPPTLRLLTTPRAQEMPVDRGMLRILHAAFLVGTLDVKVIFDDFDQMDSDTMTYGSVVGYRSVPITYTLVRLYRSGNMIRDLKLNLRAGEYSTLIILGCGDSLGVALLRDSDTGAQMLRYLAPNPLGDVEQSKISTTFAIVPNPAVESATITCPTNDSARMNIALYDTQGRMVSDRNQLPSGKGTITLSTAAYPAGIYTVVLRDAQERIRAVGKLVVMH